MAVALTRLLSYIATAEIVSFPHVLLNCRQRRWVQDRCSMSILMLVL